MGGWPRRKRRIPCENRTGKVSPLSRAHPTTRPSVLNVSCVRARESESKRRAEGTLRTVLEPTGASKSHVEELERIDASVSSHSLRGPPLSIPGSPANLMRTGHAQAEGSSGATAVSVERKREERMSVSMRRGRIRTGCSRAETWRAREAWRLCCGGE